MNQTQFNILVAAIVIGCIAAGVYAAPYLLRLTPLGLGQLAGLGLFVAVHAAIGFVFGLLLAVWFVTVIPLAFASALANFWMVAVGNPGMLLSVQYAVAAILSLGIVLAVAFITAFRGWESSTALPFLGLGYFMVHVAASVYFLVLIQFLA